MTVALLRRSGTIAACEHSPCQLSMLTYAYRRAILAPMVLMLSAAVEVGAQTITFDNITQAPTFPIIFDGTVRVPTHFEGFVFDGKTEWYLGYQNAWIRTLGFWSNQFPAPTSVSVAVWANANVALWVSRDTPFTFLSASLGGMSSDCSNTRANTVTVSGFRASVTAYSDARTLACRAYRTEVFNFLDVDRVQFSSIGPLGGNLVLDHLVMGPAVTVPEPTTLGFVGGGVLLLLVRGRSRARLEPRLGRVHSASA